MKISKGLAIFLGTLILGSCFDPPEFPTTPQIEFNRVEFIDNPSASGSDSLVIYVDFKDGDGNLGIDGEDDVYRSAPFNDSYFFQENNGKFDTLSTLSAQSATDNYDILVIPNPSRGKLVNFRTRKKTPYNTILPALFHCSSYEFTGDRTGTTATGRKLLIEQAAYAAVPPGAKVVDTLTSSSPPRVYYQLRDTLYFARNPNHNNIEVDFFYKEPNNPQAGPDGFVELDWFKTYCAPFDGRFPFLSNHENSLEGTLSYAMISTGFQSIFSVKTMKLRIQIKDRALNKSNTLVTPEFTLDKIRKK
jgi:hypothetical protein